MYYAPGTKERFYIKKKVNSHRRFLFHFVFLGVCFSVWLWHVLCDL